MRRINDPLALRDYLSRLSCEPLNPAQARLLLASRGVRAQKKALEAALRLMKDPAGTAQAAGRSATMERLRRERYEYGSQALD